MNTSRIIAAVNDKNPMYKDQVGQLIFEYVEGMVGPERAPKITGMLIELPIPQIHLYMQNF